ncbi:MAG: NAD(P)/FAD-dependent oxidoreductase [Bacteroidota bacterium]
MDISTPSTIIIGAGPAGLTTAYELQKMGKTAILLEADKQVGGISKTVEIAGNRFDIGGHRFFSKVPYVNQLWQEILQDDFLVRKRMSRIHYKGKFFDYPIKPLNALGNLGLLEALMVGLSYTKVNLFPSKNKEELNFEQWVSNRFGSRLYEIFFKTYTEKVWGMPCNQISADWAAQRIKNLSLKEAVRNALFKPETAKDGTIITTLIEQFHYPRLGPGMMWEHCQKILATQNSPTYLNHKVTKVYHQNKKVTHIKGVNEEQKEFTLNGKDFISSMPLRNLIKSLEPAPPPKVLEAANMLRYRDYLTVVLSVNKPHVFPDNWIYIHTPEVKLGRIQNYKNWSPEMVASSELTTLGLEYFLWEKDEEWTWSDDSLVALGIKECVQIGIIEASDVLGGTVVRMKKAYPVYDKNYQESLEQIKTYLSTFLNLQTIGRNGLHRYNNQDHSMLTGVYAARNIAEKTYDVWQVNVEKEYHEIDATNGTSTTTRLFPQPIDQEASEEEALLFDQIFSLIDPVALGGALGLVLGVLLFLATAILLLKGGENIGANLNLLGQYLPGYAVSWTGAGIGFLEALLLGFLLGQFIAMLRNSVVRLLIAYTQNDLQKKENSDLLDKI